MNDPAIGKTELDVSVRRVMLGCVTAMVLRPSSSCGRHPGERLSLMNPRGRNSPSWSRLAWFVGLYVVSLAAFAAVVYGLRALMRR